MYLEDIHHQHPANRTIRLRMVNNHLIQESSVQEVGTHLQLLVNLSIHLELEDKFLLVILHLHLVNLLDLKMGICHLQEMVSNLLHDILHHHQVNFIPPLVAVMFQAKTVIQEELMVTGK